jgi:hypothetical protein
VNYLRTIILGGLANKQHPRAIMNIADQVAKWLLSFQHIAMTTPVTVKIGKHVFPGAKYTEDREASVEERLYLIGELPASFRRSHKVCYRTVDSERDWYIAAWFRETGFSVEWRQVHRFGSHLILAQWSMPPGWTIDKFEAKPYRRVSMTIMPAGPAAPNVIQPTEENRNGDEHSNDE